MATPRDACGMPCARSHQGAKFWHYGWHYARGASGVHGGARWRYFHSEAVHVAGEAPPS